MHARQVRSLVILAAVLAVPTLYNACGAVGRSASLASSSSTCGNRTTMSTALENGVVVKGRASPAANVFAKSKLMLDDGFAGGAARKTSDATAGVVHPTGTEFAVLVDAPCLRANAAALLEPDAGAVISRAALDDPGLRDVTAAQAITWILDRAMTTAEVSARAESEACVVGLAKNARYQLHSVINDPLYAQQTYAAADNVEAAYQAVFNSPGGLERTGSAVVVAVIDSGADLNHPDLVGHLWRGPNGYGFDVPGNSNVPSEISSEGHGTHVAGMIAAVANNGAGIAGLAPYRTLVMPIKIFANDASGNPTTSSRYIYNAVHLAIDNGAAVINMSIGSIQNGAQSDALTLQAVNDAVAAGVTVVTVIGNAALASGQGTLIDGTTWSAIPGQYAALNGVIGVGSINVADGLKSSFSNYSPTLAEIAAPGAQSGTSGVLSTIPVAMGSYGYLAGTSQAAPQVSAAAAAGDRDHSIRLRRASVGGRGRGSDREFGHQASEPHHLLQAGQPPKLR